MNVTDSVYRQIQTMIREQGMPEGTALRISVEDGGCGGRQYVMKLGEAREGDRIVEKGGVRVAVDFASLVFLEECTVDYLNTLSDSGFKIVNPAAKRSCGCGKSFEA